METTKQNKLGLSIGDKVSYSFGHLTLVETVLKIRGEGDKLELKLSDISWVSINMPTLKKIIDH